MGTPDVAFDAVISLPADADPQLVDALRRHAGLEVELGVEAEPTLLVQNVRRPVTAASIGLAGLEALSKMPLDPQRVFVVVVEGVLDDRAAARLEDAGIGFVDGAGRSWLPGNPTTSKRRPSSERSPRSMRPEGIRCAQILADHPDRPWSERTLAALADTTGVTAHRLFARLEPLGLIERQGQGRASKRIVSDAARLRRWLAEQARTRRPAALTCFVPDLEALPPQVGETPLALTGAAAAELMGYPVLTNVQAHSYRVRTDEVTLETIPAALGGFRTDKGANLVLIADPWSLGFTDARQIGETTLAPPSRVMLDLYLEPRGSSAADVFLDLWSDKVL